MQECKDMSRKLNEIMTHINYSEKVYLNKLLEELRKHFYEAYEHSNQVVYLAEIIACNSNMTSDNIAKIRLAALLHDIGKLCVSNDILSKSGKLTENEYEQVKAHPKAGYLLIKDYVSVDVAVAVLMHHERMDGSGYPLRAKEKYISEYAKIIMLADAFSAMTEDRVYQQALSWKDALIELHKEEYCYDPKYLQVLDNIVKNTDNLPVQH